MQASLETSLWIDWHKEKLLQLKLDLQTIAQKYKYKPFQNAIAFTKDCGLPGGASLRNLIDQVSHIIQEIAEYRPALGELFGIANSSQPPTAKLTIHQVSASGIR